MRPSPLHSKRARNRQRLGSIIFIFGVPALIAGCCLGAPFYNVWRGEQIARSLMPPEYPGSRLIDVEQERIPNTRWEYRTYYTSDDLETVLAYMEQHLPGFTKHSSERYSTRIEDKSLPSLITAVLVQVSDIESGVPGVEVELDADPAGTEITVILNWPDP